MPYSLSTSGKAPNVAVSTASTPASKNSSCIWATRSGRVSTRCSLQPSSAGAAEVVGAEVLALHPGAERTVEHEHALAQRIEEGGLRAATDRRCAAAGVDHRSRLRGGVLLPESINSRPVPLTIETSSAAADKVRADLLAFPCSRSAALGPGAEAVDARSAATSPSSWTETGFEGKRGETLAVPTDGTARRQGRDPRRHRRRRDARRRRASHGGRGAGPRARRRSRRVATTLLDAVPDSVDARLRRAGARRGRRLGGYQFLGTRGTRSASKLDARRGARHGRTRRSEPASTAARGSRRRCAWARDLVNEPAGGEVARGRWPSSPGSRARGRG